VGPGGANSRPNEGIFEGKSRAKMLRGYGNCIVAPLAAEFIGAFLDWETEGLGGVMK